MQRHIPPLSYSPNTVYKPTFTRLNSLHLSCPYTGSKVKTLASIFCHLIRFHWSIRSITYFGATSGAAAMFATAGLPVPVNRGEADHFLYCINRDFAVSHCLNQASKWQCPGGVFQVITYTDRRANALSCDGFNWFGSKVIVKSAYCLEL